MGTELGICAGLGISAESAIISAMSERYKHHSYPGDLHALALHNVDVQVWSQLRGISDRAAAEELIGMLFPGNEISAAIPTKTINKVPRNTVTRRQAAREVFERYLE